MGCALRTACAATLVLALALQAGALNFKIAPKEELCFHEITHKGNKVLAFFDVLSWGYGAYVYLYVNSPSNKEIQKFEAESEGRVEFTATEDGEHSFCFKNAYTETEVSFWVNTETDVALADVAKEGASCRKRVMVASLKGTVFASSDSCAFSLVHSSSILTLVLQSMSMTWYIAWRDLTRLWARRGSTLRRSSHASSTIARVC
jgi:hypothetical protein